MPSKEARIILRHEYSGRDDDDIQAGLRVWAALVTERLRKAGQPKAQDRTNEGRPA